MRVVFAVLAGIILAYSLYWAAYRSSGSPLSTDPCTVHYENGDTAYYGRGTPCPSLDPCGISECDNGVCTLVRIVPLREFQADVIQTRRGYITASVVNGGCEPITRVVSITFACQSEGYDEAKNATITVPPNEAAVVTLPRWTDSIEKDLECQLRYAGTALNVTIEGPRNNHHSCFRYVPGDGPWAGMVLTTARPDMSTCMVDCDTPGWCCSGDCVVTPCGEPPFKNWEEPEDEKRVEWEGQDQFMAAATMNSEL